MGRKIFIPKTKFLSSDQATTDGAGGWKLLKIEEHNFKKLKANLETLTVKELESILKHNKQEVPKQAKKQEVKFHFHLKENGYLF